MKRVLCLYRVSTLKQVDKKDDIPMQRRECKDFIDRMEDWVFYDERMEKGVSGYKVSAKNRDIIVEIREMAERKQFDVLLVFMFDRLGRKEDETPFLVKWFIDHGIEVWSTREGQQKLDNQVDRLMNYMRFWAASGESEKTSMRVKAAHTQMTEDGIWRGGNCPFGYKLQHLGRMGKKNRPLYDLVIDEVTAPIVQEVFDLIVRQGYGTLRAANYLNSKYENPTKIWTAQTVRSMIRNPIYTGRMHMNGVVSEPIERLRIISDQDLEFGSYAIAKRIPRKYSDQRSAENTEVPEEKTKTSVFGAYLLSGILYCGHCGKKLVGGYHTKQFPTHAYHRPVYRCYNGAVYAKCCDGPRTYSGKKVDDAVMSVVRQYFASINGAVTDLWKEKAKKQLKSSSKNRIKLLTATLERLDREQDALKREVVKSLSGESDFDRDLLKSLLADNKQAHEETEVEIDQAKKEAAFEEEHVKKLEKQFQEIVDWSAQFEKASADTQKMILARIIERIDIYRGYEIVIKFFVTLEDFFGVANEEDDQEKPLKIS